jgi:DNA polymerase beta
MEDYKAKIIDELDTLRKKEVQDKQVFKARAYAKVISQLKLHSGAISTLDDLQGIDGVGDKIRAKIGEIISTGTLKQAQMVRKERNLDITDQLMQIYGVGPVKAKQLVADYNVTSFAHLRELHEKDPSILNAKQKIGLKYVEDLQLRIPRNEMEKHEAMLKDNMPKGFTMQVVGSYRRGASDSGDIDVLLSCPKMDEAEGARAFALMCDDLQKQGYIKEILALGPKKCMGICQLSSTAHARRIDLLLTPKHEYAYAELYFTGSEKFNIAMRKHALDKGYTMNEHSMKPIREGVAEPPFMKTEKDIFTFLDYPYVAPTKRDIKKNL